MRSPKILLVEDDPVDVHLFKRALHKFDPNFEFTTVSDGQQAIDLLNAIETGEAQAPNLIVLDIKLPKVSGLDVLATIKQGDIIKKIPVVMMTSSTQSSDIEKAYELGANGFISKPPTYKQLTEALTHLAGYWLKFNTSPLVHA